MENENAGDALFFQLLFIPWLQIPLEDIAEMSIASAKTRYSKHPIPFRKYVFQKIAMPPADLFTPPANTHLVHIATAINQAISRIGTKPLPEIWGEVVTPLGFHDFAEENGLMEEWQAFQQIFSERIGAKNADQNTFSDITDALTIEEKKYIAPHLDAVLKPLPASIAAILVKGFTMNVSALNAYLRCPLEFFFTSMIKMPPQKNEAATLGNAIHFALQKLFENMKSDTQNVFPSKEMLLSYFSDFMTAHIGAFSRDSFTGKIKRGTELLSVFYEQNVLRWNKITIIESFIKTTCGHVPIKGRLDKIEFDGRDATIVDYKSGRFSNGQLKLQPASEEYVGGEYWRQAVFYTLLADKNAERWNVKKVRFDFLENNLNNITPLSIEIEVDATSKSIVKKQIMHVQEKISQLDFNTGCGNMDCPYCQLASTQ